MQVIWELKVRFLSHRSGGEDASHLLQREHDETTNMNRPSEVDRFGEACRSRDALFARLSALVDAVETAKDGEEKEMALNAFSQQKLGIARRLSELVDSLKVGQEITRPLEEVDVASCRKIHPVLVEGAALGAPAHPSVEQAAATRRDASEERAAPLKSNNTTISMSHSEIVMSDAAILPQTQPPRSDRTADSPIQELRGRDLQIEPPMESCPDELTGRANDVREASLEPSSNEEPESFCAPHTFRKSRQAAHLTFLPSDDPAVARALEKQSSLPSLGRTQGVASPRENTPRSLARWPRKVRHNLEKRIAKGRALLRLPRLPHFDLAHSTALDRFFGGLDLYPAYNRF
jgi:hypothetical protein